MGFWRYHRGPSEFESKGFAIILAFSLLLFSLALFVYYYRTSTEGRIGALLVMGFFLIISSLWFFSSVKLLKNEEIKKLLSFRGLFDPISLFFGTLFGFIGGLFFSAIFVGFLGIASMSVFYFFWFIGFCLIYLIVTFFVVQD